MLSDEMIEKFKTLYYEQFGERISKQEALSQGIALLNMMKVIHRPLQSKQNLNNKK